MSKINFQKYFFHPKSQFNMTEDAVFFGGTNSCTYCSLEASIYFLNGFINSDLGKEKALESYKKYSYNRN
eukprot:EC824569.1.p1 GENE.EC824569.1~~EC824569.1.p1  ORF type:complete len:77 (+),score=15.26 EC824569.1:24-233(+)